MVNEESVIKIRAAESNDKSYDSSLKILAVKNVIITFLISLKNFVRHDVSCNCRYVRMTL